MAAGERKLLPEVRPAADDTLVIATGFSCRTQIAQLQDRRHALHLAELLALGPRLRREEGDGPVERAAAEADTPSAALWKR